MAADDEKYDEALAHLFLYAGPICAWLISGEGTITMRIPHGLGPHRLYMLQRGKRCERGPVLKPGAYELEVCRLDWNGQPAALIAVPCDESPLIEQMPQEACDALAAAVFREVPDGCAPRANAPSTRRIQ
jgi:hypothetical protein